jgi:hypothetical protein
MTKVSVPPVAIVNLYHTEKCSVERHPPNGLSCVAPCPLGVYDCPEFPQTAIAVTQSDCENIICEKNKIVSSSNFFMRNDFLLFF